MKAFLPVLVCLIATSCWADHFYLKDKTGREYGPFEVRTNTPVQIGDQVFSVSRVVMETNPVLQAMAAIVIPEVEFRQAKMRDVVEFLNKASVANDPRKQGVHIILNIGLGSTEGKGENQEATEALPLITFTAHKTSLRQVIDVVTKIAGLKYMIQGDYVMIRLPPCIDDFSIVKIFNVDPALIKKVLGVATNRSNEAAMTRDLKVYFKTFGVNWPERSSITYLSTLGKVIVENTTENQEKIEAIFRELGLMCRQVKIDLQFIQYDMTNLTRFAPSDLDAKTLIGLWTNGYGRLLSAPTVLTRSGQEASVRGVTELIYPTAFGLGFSTNTNAVASAGAEVVIPGGFQTREVGTILSVTPEVSQNGSMIALTLTPEYVEKPEWQDYGYDVPTPTGQLRHLPMAQPLFHTYRFSTQVSVADGATVLLGGGVPTRDGKSMVYGIVTVQLVDTEGKPLKQDYNQLQGAEE